MPSTVENALHEAVEAPVGSRRSRRSSGASRICTLTFHDDGFSKQSVLVSPELFAPSVDHDTVLQISPASEPHVSTLSRRSLRHPVAGHASTPNFVFTLQAASRDVLTSYPSLEVSLLQPIANALGFANRSKVLVTEVDRDEHLASHVEIAFKDAFLTRADMWRLLTNDLVGTSIYKNQKVLFINSVRANVKAIYAKGHRVSSALLDASTKAIFRSDSSRYYILLQMSREMWDFDPDGGGEILFNKVVSGFLPELFSRWEALGTSHSVSVVLFTRMEYEGNAKGTQHQDYYRVLTTELLSSDSAIILQRLKEEFKTFLRDVSISPFLGQQMQDDNGVEDSLVNEYGQINGRPAPAIHGNILEAIHTASLQFLRSNATADLRRTGLSLIVITPGTGVFEVNHDLLLRTTDTLIENGIYIDLVCLAKIPLHSSPLFRYRTAQPTKQTMSGVGEADDTEHQEWEYTIPHWVDVSFWQSSSTSELDILGRKRQTKRVNRQHKFVPRVRMYEVQMTGLMQNEYSVTIPHLHCPYSIRYPASFGLDSKTFRSRLSVDAHDLEGSKAVYNQGSKESMTSTSPDKSPSQSHLQPFTDLLNWMDDYDDTAFKSREMRAASSVPRPTTSTLAGTAPQVSWRDQQQGVLPVHQLQITPKRKTSSASTTSRYRAPSVKFSPFSRQFGPGFKGFGAAKATATTFVSAEPVVSASPDLSLSGRPSTQVEHNLPPSVSISRPSTRASSTVESVGRNSKQEDSLHQKSKPIDIRPQSSKQSLGSAIGEREELEEDLSKPLLSDDRVAKNDRDAIRKPNPGSTLKSPWMTMLNPSNPKQLTSDMTSRLGRWQHVFPKPTQASTIKWKSLCSPACLPLTTEDFPSPEQLRTEYTCLEYEVVVPKEKEADESDEYGEWLIRELVASRLTRGFSVVVGNRPAAALGLPKAQWYEFLHEKGMSRPGVKIIMSRGTEIHELFNVKKGVVNVTRHIRVEAGSSNEYPKDYYPLIRTAYADNYIRRSFSFLSRAPVLDFERLDNFIANEEEELNEPYPGSIRFWRARFVLIPIAVSGARKRNHSPEDNEEEIRLEGIRKLTQMWQKNRFLSSVDRKYEPKTKKELKPLDILYQTRSASAIVSDELNNNLLGDGSEQKPTQLLPELFERSKVSMPALAKALQGDRGIRLLDRRWHWRLHYHCFVGLELVTWLTTNFRDIDSREEAVEFGNQLMADGLFVHVEKRHNFRDGNFFYQLTEKYRFARQDVRNSWFGRLADRSVPQTPMVESFTDESKRLASTHSPSEETETNIDEEGESLLSSSSKKPRAPKANVTLSKQLVYDMDHRKKSNRKELVNLHVDRISSADDCYHLRIDWVTATPKLIEDTIESWATTGERSGLRLVELPLMEASQFTALHPFRHPYYIKLAKEPPSQPPHAAALDASNSTPKSAGSSSGQNVLAPQQQSMWPYHKAILKKFDFVLDLEAANEFPEDVAVRYSWGTPDYRMPQYISRSGRLLVQITPDGRFLLLINQLFSGRGAAAREAQRTAAGAGSTVPPALHLGAASRALLTNAFESTQQTPRRVPITPGPPTVSTTTNPSKLSFSPFASPMIRASAGDIPIPHSASPLPQNILHASVTPNNGLATSSAASIASPLIQAPFTQTHQQPSPPQPPLSKSELLTVRELRMELENFCSDPVALERFYEEELHRPLATVPATPIVRPMSTLPGIEETTGAGAVPPVLNLKEDTR